MEHSQWEILRPGATRLNLSWFSSQLENQFVIDAVKLVAEEGWKLLPLYRFNNETGTGCSTNRNGHHFCERTTFLRTNKFVRDFNKNDRYFLNENFFFKNFSFLKTFEKKDIRIYVPYSRPNGWTEWAETF